MRLVRLWAHHAGAALLRPRSLELRAVLVRVVSLEPVPILVDTTGNHHFAGFLKDRPPLLAVRIQQSLTAPALQRRCQFPAEIGGVLQPGIQSETAIRRVLMACVTSD